MPRRRCSSGLQIQCLTACPQRGCPTPFENGSASALGHRANTCLIPFARSPSRCFSRTSKIARPVSIASPFSLNVQMCMIQRFSESYTLSLRAFASTAMSPTRQPVVRRGMFLFGTCPFELHQGPARLRTGGKFNGLRPGTRTQGFEFHPRPALVRICHARRSCPSTTTFRKSNGGTRSQHTGAEYDRYNDAEI
jgi:hypothetical protein